MPDYKLGFKGAYIAAVEFVNSKPSTLTIESVKLDVLEDDKGRKRDRWIIRFVGRERGWVLNSTNAQLLVALWGRDTDNWVKHTITLGTMKVPCSGNMVDGFIIVGSPELKAPRAVTVKLPRKKPKDYTLVPTGKGTAPAPDAEPRAERAQGEG